MRFVKNLIQAMALTWILFVGSCAVLGTGATHILTNPNGELAKAAVDVQTPSNPFDSYSGDIDKAEPRDKAKWRNGRNDWADEDEYQDLRRSR